MSNIPNELSYTKEHEWVQVVDGVATMGITDHAQDALGDIVYVDMPEVGTQVKASDEIANIDSVKASSPIYSPVDGEIVEINDSLTGGDSGEEAWELINNDPYGNGWLCKIKVADGGENDDLLTAEDYRDMLSDS